QGITTEPLNYRNPQPFLQIRANDASPLNRKALSLKARGFKLIYLLPQHLRLLDEKLILFPCYHQYYIALSSTALSDIPRFLNSPILKSTELIIDAQTTSPLAYDALNKIVFYGQNFADIRPLNFSTPILRHLDPQRFPHAALILNETLPIYVPFHEAQEEGFYLHRFRAIDLHKRLDAVNARARKYQFPSQNFDLQEQAYITNFIHEANDMAYRLIYSTGWYLLHNTAFFYLLLHHPKNVSYQYDSSNRTLAIMAYPDPYQSAFYYTLEMPWFDPVPQDGVTSLLFKSPLLQTYFRYVYSIFFALEHTQYKYGKDLFSLTAGQLQELFQEWEMLEKLPGNTERKVRKLLWSLAVFKRKIKFANHHITNALNFLDTKHGRYLRGCADLVTAPTFERTRHKDNL
ncbi:MAG: hypothetical protein J6Y94_01740, partial [Bacteriovoracaceae bacterium]|nr:hypothetical protein [Bacteriovoracaceae bacterium]